MSYAAYSREGPKFCRCVSTETAGKCVMMLLAGRLYRASSRSRCSMKTAIAIFALALVPFGSRADLPLPFPGIQPLDWPEEDLSGRMMDGAHRFVERKIAEAGRERGKLWQYDSSSEAAWNAGLEGKRTG